MNIERTIWKRLSYKSRDLVLTRRSGTLRRSGGISSQNAQFLGYSIGFKQHIMELSSPYASQFLWRTARNALSLPRAVKTYLNKQ